MTTYPNYALDATCEEIEALDLTPDQIEAMLTDLPRELAARRENRAEAAYAEEYDPERIAARGEAYRREMIAAGRGAQLGGGV